MRTIIFTFHGHETVVMNINWIHVARCSHHVAASPFTGTNIRSSHPEVFLGKGVLKIRSKFTREHPCRRATSSKLQLLWNFIEIALRHGCSPVNLLHIFRTPFLRNTYGWLLLNYHTYEEIFKEKHYPLRLP